MLGLTTTRDPSSKGMKDIAEALGGGIREGSLVIVEGEAKTGKSVLCQHIAYGVLTSKVSPVCYISSEYNSSGLLARMRTMNLDASREFQEERFKIYKLDSSTLMKDAAPALQFALDTIGRLPQQFKLAIIDSPSIFMARLNPVFKTDFLQACKEMSQSQDLSIILVLDTYVFESKTLSRARAMADYYLTLRTQDPVIASGQLDTRIIKVLEVSKLCGADRPHKEGLRFEIKPTAGIQILPFIQIRV